MVFSRALLPHASAALLGTSLMLACAAEGSTSAEIDESSSDAAGASASTTKDAASKDSASKDAGAANDARNGAGDSATDAAKDTASDSGNDAAKDSGAKDAGKVDSSTTGADCPIDPAHIAEAFVELLSASPTMCLSNACPASKCCMQIYGVCINL